MRPIDANKLPYENQVLSYDDEWCLKVSDIENAPTIDAVEVVRCGNCKHYGWEQEPCHGRVQRFCKLPKGLISVWVGSFCSYGERRDDR